MRRTFASSSIDITDDLRAAIVARSASIDQEPAAEAASSVSDRDRVMAGIEALVQGGWARWSAESASTADKILVLMSGERFAVTEAGIARIRSTDAFRHRR